MRSRPPESSAKSRRRPRQGRPDVPAKVVRSSFGVPADSSPARVFAWSLHYRVVQQAPPGSVRVTRQALQGRPPSQSRPPSSAVHAKVVRCPCQSPAKSADRPVGRQGLLARQSSTVAARLALQAPCQSFLGCPVLVTPQSSAVPAHVVRRPRQSRPPSSC